MLTYNVVCFVYILNPQAVFTIFGFFIANFTFNGFAYTLLNVNVIIWMRCFNWKPHRYQWGDVAVRSIYYSQWTLVLLLRSLSVWTCLSCLQTKPMSFSATRKSQVITPYEHYFSFLLDLVRKHFVHCVIEQLCLEQQLINGFFPL